MNVSKVNKMTVVRKVREMHPGDEYMQHELELLEDLSNETVDSAARKSRKIGLEQGRRENAYETAKRLVQLGYSDEDIQKINKAAEKPLCDAISGRNIKNQEGHLIAGWTSRQRLSLG